MDGAAVADVDQDLAGEELLGEVGVEVLVDGDHDDVGGADGLVLEPRVRADLGDQVTVIRIMGSLTKGSDLVPVLAAWPPYEITNVSRIIT